MIYHGNNASNLKKSYTHDIFCAGFGVDQKCGLVPRKVFLSKGEKRQLVFWTDQDYRLAKKSK